MFIGQLLFSGVTFKRFSVNSKRIKHSVQMLVVEAFGQNVGFALKRQKKGSEGKILKMI